MGSCGASASGIPYDEYPEFMAAWAGLNEKSFERTLLDHIVPLVPDVAAALGRRIDVLEIGCGEGHALNLLARAHSQSRFVGYEFREAAVREATAKASALGLRNVRFVEKDLRSMNEAAAFDLVAAFDVIHDQAAPRVVLAKVFEALRPGGTFLMVDIRASSHVHENRRHPMAAFLYGTSVLHCMTVSLALGGEGLGTMWGEQKARELLREAGFTEVEAHAIEGDPFNTCYVARKPS